MLRCDVGQGCRALTPSSAHTAPGKQAHAGNIIGLVLQPTRERRDRTPLVNRRCAPGRLILSVCLSSDMWLWLENPTSTPAVPNPGTLGGFRHRLRERTKKTERAVHAFFSATRPSCFELWSQMADQTSSSRARAKLIFGMVITTILPTTVGASCLSSPFGGSQPASVDTGKANHP